MAEKKELEKQFPEFQSALIRRGQAGGRQGEVAGPGQASYLSLTEQKPSYSGSVTGSGRDMILITG